jgi:hypothetical protein
LHLLIQWSFVSNLGYPILAGCGFEFISLPSCFIPGDIATVSLMRHDFEPMRNCHQPITGAADPGFLIPTNQVPETWPNTGRGSQYLSFVKKEASNGGSAQMESPSLVPKGTSTCVRKVLMPMNRPLKNQ